MWDFSHAARSILPPHRHAPYLERDQAADAKAHCITARRNEALHIKRAVVACLAPHPPHQGIDINIPENLDQIVGIIVVAALAVAARHTHQAALLVQG